jgi:hypothetical protein
VKSIRQQVAAMQRYWPAFDLGEESFDKAVWFGPLAGLERKYRLMIEYGLPTQAAVHEMYRRFPLVRVLSPPLELRFDALEEAPLPHVYFTEVDLTLSPLCLFDVEADEWSHDDLIRLPPFPGPPIGSPVTRAGLQPAAGMEAGATLDRQRRKHRELHTAAPIRWHHPKEA